MNSSYVLSLIHHQLNKTVMYTANKTNGIGQVTSEDATTYTVYFEETDKTCRLLKDLTKIYATSEEAEKSLEMTNEQKESYVENMKAEEQVIRKGIAASAHLSDINRENSKKLYFK